ncbi:MAG: tRNA pseudouridine(55) synthase TruB, partial [Burkholderiaceae bacterium]|nr:tRNA pseudouridine(55) synthase TruB [Burkholderiaceae bacterium]
SPEKEGIALPAAADRVRVYEAASGKLLGTARIREGVLAPERLIAAAVE